MSAWYGIVSFCEEPDNLLLWAHYGDSHRGIALGIQFDAENEPIKVEYLPENKRRTIRKDQNERIADERKAEGLREPNYCKRDYCRDCISSEISPTSLTADDRWN
jgi:Protein of unknown function (DUF2971)